MRITCDNLKAAGQHYAPVVAGNGSLGFQIDNQGAMFQQDYGHGLVPGIRRAGFRYDNTAHSLVPFGWFEHELAGAGEVTDWSQTLDTDAAVVETRCEHRNGMTVETQVFCHLERDVIAIRKRITGGDKVDFTFKYQPGQPKRMWLRHEGGQIHYNVDEGQYQGVVTLWSDALKPAGDGALRGDAREFTVILAFDQPDGVWDFDALFASHRSAWKAYWDESYVRLPDQRMQEAYYTAQYHLRISSTKWSIPVGLQDTHWHGRFFGFDEYFAYRGIVSSGHLDAARKVPEFRCAGLDSALQRASRYFPGVENGAALYPWETLENGKEGAPPGFWLEHIFHMANIAMECADDYLFSGDLDFLRDKGYPVIKACARYYELMSVHHRLDGSVIVGKCTDLERLGAGRENAFMTSCGVIATFDAAARAADALGVDAGPSATWRQLAAGLRTTLPHDGAKYLPHPGCEQKSVAVFSGTFPYPALPLDDPKQRAAVEDFNQAGASAGNMYPVGKGLCAWYAALMAIYHARRGDGEAAYKLLHDTATDTGCFSEIYEIHETGAHPWFTTAEGSYVQAVNELLLQVSPDGSFKTAPAVPAAWKDYAFKLQGPKGKMVEGGTL